jgi:hypothetical protein
MARTRSGKIYNTLVAVTPTKSVTKTTTPTPTPHVPYTCQEILSWGLTTPTIKLHEGLTPAMYAMWQAKCQIAGIARPRYYKVVLEILDTHGSVALGHVSNAKDTLLQWALSCFMLKTEPEEEKILVKLIHTIIHHMDTPKEMSVYNYNRVTPLFWAIYLANDVPSKRKYLNSIIIHLLNKCDKMEWTHKDIELQTYWHRKFGVPKMFLITDLTTPEINKLLIKTFLIA